MRIKVLIGLLALAGLLCLLLFNGKTSLIYQGKDVIPDKKIKLVKTPFQCTGSDEYIFFLVGWEEAGNKYRDLLWYDLSRDKLRYLTRKRFIRDFIWLPEKQSIICAVEERGRAEIHSIDLKNGKADLIKKLGENERAEFFSKGNKDSNVFFQLSNVGERYIYKLDPKSNEISRISRRVAAGNCGVMPDGKSLVCIRKRSVPEAMYRKESLVLLDVETSEEKYLDPGGTHTLFGSPIVSPNGQFVAYSRETSVGEERFDKLLIMNLHTGKIAGQWGSKEHFYNPYCWSGNEALLFSIWSNTDSTGRVFLYEILSGKAIEIADYDFREFMMARWIQNTNLIVYVSELRSLWLMDLSSKKRKQIFPARE